MQYIENHYFWISILSVMAWFTILLSTNVVISSIENAKLKTSLYAKKPPVVREYPIDSSVRYPINEYILFPDISLIDILTK